MNMEFQLTVLSESTFSDKDFDNVRSFDWFKRVVKLGQLNVDLEHGEKTKLMLEDEIQELQHTVATTVHVLRNMENTIKQAECEKEAMAVKYNEEGLADDEKEDLNMHLESMAAFTAQISDQMKRVQQEAEECQESVQECQKELEHVVQRMAKAKQAIQELTQTLM